MSDPSVIESQPQTPEQRDVRRRRREFATSKPGKLARVFVEAMTEYFKFRRAGVSRFDAVKGLEEVIREHWPFPSSKVQPNCDECEDTGWRERWCRDASRCGRRWCVDHAESEHTYVEPCFCAAGAKNQPRQSSAGDDAIIAAGRRRKPKQRGFSQLGVR